MKKMLNKLPFKKFIAVFTSVTFIFTGVFGNSAFASIGSSMPAIENINFDNPIIPTSLGKITSAKFFDSEDIIINIQDLHCHAETQRKIASIIGYIDNIYNLKNVYLEGAFNTVDTSWLSAFNNNKNGTKVLEGLIDSGKLSGTEYYSIMNNKKNFVLGIEKEELYKENIKLLGAILSLQPEIEAICSQMEKEVNKIKRDYSSRQARKLQKIIKSFKEKEIDAKYFYGQLKILADSSNLSLDKYPNIKIYISLLDKAQYVNDRKVVHEFAKFIAEIKNILPYQKYLDLLKNSNNFSNLEDISAELISLNKQYSITSKMKLTNFENFLTYLEFNQNINPIKLVQEEENFINELYIKLGRTKYEKEVAFLSDFVPTIKQYFAADISADEYYKFEKNYSLFKATWPSYFSENIIKNLEPYQKLLAKYHKNNITRDQIFADCLITQKNTNNKVAVNDITSAIKQIKTNLNNKKLKLVVTGGFHTRGLERIFEQQKISYVIITPKITQPIEQAKQIYIDNVKYYSNLLKNTINLEPLTQEPLNVSFPKILNLIFSEIQKNTIFEEYSKDQVNQGIKDFVQEYIIAKQSGFYGNVEILNWDITSIDSKNRAEFYVEYKDNVNKGTISNIKYRFIDGQIVPYSSIDTARTKQMLERIKVNKDSQPSYAQPSIELEPTDATRKKISEYILEPLETALKPLEDISGKKEKKVTLMPFEQLHITIGYDSAPTQQQIDSLVQQNDTDGDIFYALDVLGEDFVNFKTFMSGTLKLMPDGVIIYEITDKDLIENMLKFRTTLKNIDSKFATPSIVHMSIGRITDMKLLDGSEQSKRDLAELLEKINETIYEINKKNALSKIRTSFTLKAGYVSSTGDKDFVFRRILPKKESLVVFKNLVIKSKITFETVYEIVIAPIVEETIFRFIPFIVTGLIVSNPVSIVPAIVTGIIGIFGFSFAHPLADKINNFLNKKVEGGEIRNDFIAELFSNRVNVRNVRDFFIPSTILTAVFITASFVFPQSIFAAIIISSISHSVYNLISARLENKLLLALMQDSSSKDKNLDFEIDQIIDTLEDISRNKYLGYRQERSDFIDDFESIGEDKNIITQKVIDLFNFVAENHKKSNSFDLVFLLEPILNISAYLRDEQGNLLFDKFFDYILKQATDKKNNSTRYFEVLTDSAKYFYKTGQIGCVHKIFDSLYKNKGSVITMTDYKKFALPVPSPFSFDSIAEWEYEVYKIMDTDDSFTVWFIPMLEILLSSPSGEIDEYAKAYIRALYKSGKATKPPFIRGIDEYEWTKSFYEICEEKENSTQQEQSEPLLDEENIKLFADNAEILKTNNLYLSDIISRLQFLKQDNPSNEIFNSEEYAKILEQLKAALTLSKQEQIEAVTTQMNELAFLFIDNDCFRDTKVLKMLVPIMAFIESTETSQSLLSYVTRNLNVRYVGYEDMVLDIISFMYDINKQEALSLIKGLYNEFRKQDKFGANRSQWTPKNLQAAYANIPAQLKDKIKTYKELEEFYYTIGIEFDSIQEESAIYDRRLYIPEYQLLLDRIPASVSGAKQQTIKYFRSLKKQFLSSQATDEDNNNASLYFEALENVLENNMLALSEINKANRDAIEDSFYFIEEMINSFAVLNEEAADKAKVSLERMKKDFYSHKVTVSDLVSLKKWAVADMDKITELHTLINAVHQTAIGSLMSKLKFSNIGNQYVFKENDTEHLNFFDCSRTGMSKQMEDFVSSLNLVTFLKSGVRIVSKDNKIIYSKSLGAHSVDIMVDLDEGIRVTFNDSGRGDGNAMRVLLLASLFSQVGFDITNIDTKVSGDTYAYGVCNFTAMYSLPKGVISNGIDYAKYFEQALNILGDVTDLDYDIEGNDVDSDKHSYHQFDIPSYNLEDFAKLKNSTNMPRGFERISTLKQEWQTRSTVLGNLKKQIDQKGVGVGLDEVYDYLSITSDKRNVWGIVSEYVKGRLTINKEGILERKGDYDGIDVLLKAIKANIDDSSRQSQVINLLDYGEFNFETEGYIGGMVALSGLLRLDGNGWLSVKAAVDKERKRAKFAYVEFVDFEGNRKPLKYDDLISILTEFKYTVKKQKSRSNLEIKEALKVLKEKILYPKDGIYTRGMAVSGQADKYIPVKITYDKSKVKQDSMWVVSYTTPDDVATIKNAGAIMTTNGGMLSHANITARENKKTAILSNGRWVDGKLEVPFYRIKSEIKQHGEYETQMISEETVVLEEGDVVLANGINGRVLVYKDIPRETIDAIQNAIDNNDIDFIKSFIEKHSQDRNIRELVEYIFLQVITDKEKKEITKFLLECKFPKIHEKVSELSKVYVGEKIKALKIYIENEKSIKDAKIKSSILNFIYEELDILKYYINDTDKQDVDMLDQLKKIEIDFNNEQKKVSSKIKEEVKNILKTANEILAKPEISEQEKDDLIKISDMAKAWKYYGNPKIKELVSRIDSIISLEEGISYETEIREFENIRAKDVGRYGIKTTELAKISKFFKDKKINIAMVPHGIGISKDVLRIFFEQNGLGEEYSKLMKDFQQAIESKEEDKALRIGRQISNHIESLKDKDKQLESYLKSKLDANKKYAVRSSGIGEDGATDKNGKKRALAGMFQTDLNKGIDELYSSVIKCWEAFFTDTCIEDMAKTGIFVQPALLIQEMVPSVKKAGVMFTRDNSGNLAIEAVLGLGEGLVSGRITPDHIIVRASNGRIDYRRALNNMIKISEKEGGTKVSKLTEEEKIERILDEKTIKKLQEIANILEEDAGYPVDIEFAIDGNGKIFVLQRRAITTLPSFEGIDYSKTESSSAVSVPVIEQYLLDELSETLSLISNYNDKAKELLENISKIPTEAAERYKYAINLIYDLADLAKEFNRPNYHIQISLEDKYGNYASGDTKLGKLREFCLQHNIIKAYDGNLYLNKVVIYLLVPFLSIIDVQNSNKMLFYSIVDYLFVDKDKERDDRIVLSDMGTLMGASYSLNSNFIEYIVNKLIEKNFLSEDDDDMPYSISSELRDSQEAERQYYFAMSAKYPVDKNLSEILEETVKKLNADTVPLITDNETQTAISETIKGVNAFVNRINTKNIPLLYKQLSLLLEQAIALTDTDKQAAFQIISAIISVSDRILYYNRDINSRAFNLNKLEKVLISEYNSQDKTFFNTLLSEFISIIQPQFYDMDRESFNNGIVSVLINVALHIYSPIASGELIDESSEEYQIRKKQCLDIFRSLSVVRPQDNNIYDNLFNTSDQYSRNKKEGVGLNLETLKIAIDASKQNRTIFNVKCPNEDFILGDIDALANMVADSIEFVDPVNMFTYSFADEIEDYENFYSKRPREKAKQLSLSIMEKLVSMANDETVNLAKRKRIIIVLMNALSKGLYSDNIEVIPIDFENIRTLANRFDVPIYIQKGDIYVRNNNGEPEYTFTPLLKSLPEHFYETKKLITSWLRKGEEVLVSKKPLITRIKGNTDNSKIEVQQVLFRFEVLQKILQYNTSVLSLMDKIKDSKNYEKNMAELLNELQAMINELKKISVEHGAAAQMALDNIKTSLKDPSIDRKTHVRRHLLLSEWNEETIKDIKEIHTLINAVHQTSILDFKQEIGNVRDITSNPIQVITAEQTSTVSGYNLSNTINSNIVRFLSHLATRKLPNNNIDDFMCKDDLIVWTTRLNAHSVDIFFNFGELDRGINIYYRERPVSGEDIGKKERIRYFKEILEYLGFHVETDVQYVDNNESYGLKATLNKDYGMNEATDLIDIATHVVEIFKFSTNVDYDLRSRQKKVSYENVFKRWMKKAKRRELWYRVNINNFGWRAYGYGPGGESLDSLPDKKNLSAETLNEILAYCGCDLLPDSDEGISFILSKPYASTNLDPDKYEDRTAANLQDPIYLERYFNKPIERAFVEGRLILNKEGVLVRKDFDIVHSMIDEINKNFTETSQQARIVNLVNNYEFDTRILADIGSFVVVSSVMELKNGDKLFVRAIMDPNTKRTKYAIAELVTTKTRVPLKSRDLIELLGKEGYKIPEQEWVDSRERQRTKNLLTRDVQTIESPKIQSTPTSDGTGISVVGNITFDRNNVDKNSILIVPYTTPNDMKSIETAKGIITTGGGVLSHAAITTRELKKPSVVLSGATWIDDEIETLYYLPSGEVELLDEQFQVRKVKTTRKTLKEGTRVLMNGETGMVLLFDDIASILLDRLQYYVDTDDAEEIVDFMNEYAENENINRLVEYVYFQVIGNPKTTKILDSLFSEDMPETVKNKINKLNDGYIQDKIQNISEAIENLKTIENVNIKYSILQELIKKLNFIKTIGVRQDLENLKEQIEGMETDIKDSLDIFMQQFINDLSELLAKDELNSTNVQKILSMLKNVEIYKYFISESETSKDLIVKKDTIQFLVSVIKDRINSFTMDVENVDLKKEISLFEENASDERLFGSKTSQLAKMFKLLLEEEGVIVPGGIGISVRIMPLLFKTLGQESLLAEFENAIKNRNKERAMEIAKVICAIIDSQEMVEVEDIETKAQAYKKSEKKVAIALENKTKIEKEIGIKTKAKIKAEAEAKVIEKEIAKMRTEIEEEVRAEENERRKAKEEAKEKEESVEELSAEEAKKYDQQIMTPEQIQKVAEQLEDLNLGLLYTSNKKFKRFVGESTDFKLEDGIGVLDGTLGKIATSKIRSITIDGTIVLIRTANSYYKLEIIKHDNEEKYFSTEAVEKALETRGVFLPEDFDLKSVINERAFVRISGQPRLWVFSMTDSIMKEIERENKERENKEIEKRLQILPRQKILEQKQKEIQTRLDEILASIFELQENLEDANKKLEEAQAMVKEVDNIKMSKKVFIQSVSPKRTKFEEEIKKQLDKFITSDGKYSVRSSGVGEDATNNAFAGMGETSLNVKYGDVYDNVRKCWKSFFAERCIDYMISSGQVVKPAVLVEEMIDSEISGVAFTRNKYGNGTINALFGQGEGLVSGMFTPDDVLFDMKSGEIIEYSVANKQFQLVTDVNGGIKKVPVGQKAKTRTLDSRMVKRLASVFSILENAVGYPIDVEFAIKEDKIYILQMRPITTLDSKDKAKENVADANIDTDIINMDEIPFAETKYEISLSVGNIKDKKDVFVYIQDPSNPTKSIPIYRTSVNGQFTEFVVDSKYTPLVKSGVLSRLLLHRINTDPVVLAKLNGGLFNFKSGEIALMPVLDEDTFEEILLENTFKDEMNNVRRMLASA